MVQAVLVDVIRTPSGRGKPGGMFSAVHPVDLLAGVLATLCERNELDPALVDDVIGGCVSQLGEQGANITRTALLAAGFPEGVPAVTIDRQCGSSQQAVSFAAQGVLAGSYDVVIACGVESMSRVPLGSATAGIDSFGERFRRRYPRAMVGQGVAAELVAERYGLSREDLDVYAARSHALAGAATASGVFRAEVVPVPGVVSEVDETLRPGTTVSALSALSPVFRTPEVAGRFPDLDWKVTAGNSSPLTDGASAALIMSERRARQLGLRPRARFHAFAVTGSDPLLMLTGVIPATRQVLSRAGLSVEDIDVFEINEAFASVPLAWLREIPADPAKLNPRGGAIALGHPVGASGTRLLATMTAELEASGGRWGLQGMCEGGGMANATIVERLG